MTTIVLAATMSHTPAAAQVITQAGYYLGISVACGFGSAIAFLAGRDADGVAVRVRAAAPLFAAVVGLTAAAYFADEVAGGRGRDAGPGPVVQLALSAVLVLVMLVSAGRASRALGAVVLVLGVLVGLVPNLPTGAIDTDGLATDVITAVHVCCITVWLGGLIVLAIVGLLGLRNRSDGAARLRLAEDWHRVWNRYSTVALYCVGGMLLTGSWLAWVHVGTVGELVSTPYGRYLAIKLALVATMLVLGALNHAYLIPRIATARAAGETGTVVALAVRRFPLVTAVEALLGVGVLTIVPFFMGSARAEAGGPSARPFDLTVFGTGAVLAALIAAALWTGSRVRIPARG